MKKIKVKWFHRVRFFNVSNVVWWFFQLPKMFVHFIICKVKKKSFNVYYENIRLVNEIRKTCNYFSEKDNQTRKTIKAKYRHQMSAIEVKMRFDKKATENEYSNFKDTLSIHASRTTDITFKKGWAYFYMIKDFQPVYEYDCSKTSVTVGTGMNGLLYWNWTKVPHMLSVGETGQGKSVFIRYVLNGLFKGGHEVWCVDGKVVDYTSSKHLFKYYVKNTVTNNEEIISIVEKFQRYMMLRLEEMEKMGVDEYHKNDSLKPKFLLLDEYLIMAEQMDKKEERKRLEIAIQDITLRGRAAGYYLILTMQRGDAKFIPGNIRDNFRFKIVVGNATDTSYRMMFEDTVRGFEVGKAWYTTGLGLDVLAIPYYESIEVCENKENIKDEENSNKSATATPRVA